MSEKRGRAAAAAHHPTLVAVLLAAAAVAALAAAPSRAQQSPPPSKNSSSSSSTSLPSSPSKNSSFSSSPSPDSLFEGPEGGRNLVIVGRYLAADDTRLPQAAAFRGRGAARLRAAGTPDPAADVVLGETAERLASRPGAAPEGVEFGFVLDTASGRRVRVYSGEAFRRALDEVPEAADGALGELRERALAGALRARFPLPGVTLVSKWEETVAWLTFAEAVRSPRVAEGVSRRLEKAAPALARLLLAAGKMEDLTALDRRLTDASQRLEALEPDPAKARRLRDAARAVRALRGNGRPPFPQEIWLTPGPGAAVVRIEGEIGALVLVVAARPDAPKAAATRRVLAAPLLPVPGSLAVTPDRRAVTWLEVETPTRLARVAYALDGSGPVPAPERAASAKRQKVKRRNHQ